MAYDTVNIPHVSTANLPASIIAMKRDNYRMEEDRAKKIAFIKRRMNELGYNPRSLSLKATGKEDTVRNLLRGASRNWRQDNYEAIMRVLGEDNFYTVDEMLMLKAAAAINKVADTEGKKLTLEEAMALTVELYNHVMRFRKLGEDIAPNAALASLIIKKS